MTSAQPVRNIIVGVDFDNTLVSYDNLIHLVAEERGLIDPETQASKKLVRDSIRKLPYGETEWQKVQALVYGPRIGEAVPSEGATEFLEKCFRHGVKVNIVSHKTEFASYDETGTNLRSAALSWLKQHNLLDSKSYGLKGDDIYFEATREDKIKRIEKLGCTHFIDDLEETFLEQSFPDTVKKLLYSPHLPTPTVANVELAGTWEQMANHIFHDASGLTSAYFAGLVGTEVITVEQMNGGGNSRVLEITATDGSKFAAKIYPGPTADGRDRLSVEFATLTFLRNHGVECVPKPIVSDAGKQCSVFEYVEGSKIASQDVTGEDIDQAYRFLARLDDLKNYAEARQLPNAAEACFSVQAIMDNLGSRLARLEKTEAADFLTSEFMPVFQSAVAWCEAKTTKSGGSIDTALALKDRTLSPSDFGFHNAVRGADGTLFFLDFEYFGWDDPAKMVSDFLLHPAMDLSSALKTSFVANLVGDDQVLMGRLETVFPLFGLKWCLILLNAFLPQYRLQRGLDDSGLDWTLERQSEKARLMLSTVKETYERFPYRD